jgi:hypothetical protein
MVVLSLDDYLSDELSIHLLIILHLEASLLLDLFSDFIESIYVEWLRWKVCFQFLSLVDEVPDLREDFGLSFSVVRHHLSSLELRNEVLEFGEFRDLSTSLLDSDVLISPLLSDLEETVDELLEIDP